MRYISKGEWFDKGTEVTLIDDYRKDNLNSGLFYGIKYGKRDEEICSFEEFEIED
jgi:hypothetical protein